MGKTQKIKELTALSSQSGFWNNQEEARTILEELSNLQKDVRAIEDLEFSLIAIEEKEKPSGNDIEQFEKELQKLELKTLLTGEFDDRDALITFMSGAGGHDAQEWTQLLLQMYEQYAQKREWKSALIHQSFGELGGLKEATLEINGSHAYGFLKKESGIHRLVRISPFSSKKLRHTSFALVEVLPVFKEIPNIETLISPSDVRVDVFRSSGPGGQNVNKRETAVRVTHLPTGLVGASQLARSQAQNRQKAFELLYAKLHKLMRQKRLDTIQGLRDQVKIEWGHQIRSYVFDPYQLVKDHRTNIETGNIERVLEGELDSFIEAELINQDI